MIFSLVQSELEDQHLRVVDKDHNLLWGGFFVIEEEQTQRFAYLYFDGLEVSSLKISGKLSAKILVVEPTKRLSWQYHHKMAQIWRVIQGQAGVVRSCSDSEN